MKYSPLDNQPNVTRTRAASTSPSLKLDSRSFPHITWLEEQLGRYSFNYSFWDGLKWSYKDFPEIYVSKEEITTSPCALVLDDNESPVSVFSRKIGSGNRLSLASYNNQWNFNNLDVSYDLDWIGVTKQKRGITYSSSSSSSTEIRTSSSSSSSSSSYSSPSSSSLSSPSSSSNSHSSSSSSEGSKYGKDWIFTRTNANDTVYDASFSSITTLSCTFGNGGNCHSFKDYYYTLFTTGSLRLEKRTYENDLLDTYNLVGGLYNFTYGGVWVDEAEEKLYVSFSGGPWATYIAIYDISVDPGVMIDYVGLNNNWMGGIFGDENYLYISGCDSGYISVIYKVAKSNPSVVISSASKDIRAGIHGSTAHWISGLRIDQFWYMYRWDANFLDTVFKYDSDSNGLPNNFIASYTLGLTGGAGVYGSMGRMDYPLSYSESSSSSSVDSHSSSTSSSIDSHSSSSSSSSSSSPSSSSSSSPSSSSSSSSSSNSSSSSSSSSPSSSSFSSSSSSFEYSSSSSTSSIDSHSSSSSSSYDDSLYFVTVYDTTNSEFKVYSVGAVWRLIGSMVSTPYSCVKIDSCGGYIGIGFIDDDSNIQYNFLNINTDSWSFPLDFQKVVASQTYDNIVDMDLAGFNIEENGVLLLGWLSKQDEYFYVCSEMVDNNATETPTDYVNVVVEANSVDVYTDYISNGYKNISVYKNGDFYGMFAMGSASKYFLNYSHTMWSRDPVSISCVNNGISCSSIRNQNGRIAFALDSGDIYYSEPDLTSTGFEVSTPDMVVLNNKWAKRVQFANGSMQGSDISNTYECNCGSILKDAVKRVSVVSNKVLVPPVTTSTTTLTPTTTTTTVTGSFCTNPVICLYPPICSYFSNWNLTIAKYELTNCVAYLWVRYSSTHMGIGIYTDPGFTHWVCGNSSSSGYPGVPTTLNFTCSGGYGSVVWDGINRHTGGPYTDYYGVLYLT